MSKKITAIIPVYNGEKYLRRCVDSLLNQAGFDVNDIEVLLLNDGSRDGSQDIINQYVHSHPDVIRGLTHKNMGVARTRNKGIDQATGQYIIFIDQDDWIEEDYCATFHNAIEESGADVVGGGYVRPDRRGKIVNKSCPDPDYEYSKYIVVAAWAKIHRLDFLRKHSVRFFENKFGEDNVFTIREMKYTKKWKQIRYSGYNWFMNETSVSNTSQKGFKEADVESILELLRNLVDSAPDASDQDFRYYVLRTSVFYLLFSGRRAGYKNFMHAYHKIRPWIKRYADINRIALLKPKGEYIYVRAVIFAFVLLDRLHLVGLFARFFASSRS